MGVEPATVTTLLRVRDDLPVWRAQGDHERLYDDEDTQSLWAWHIIAILWTPDQMDT